MRRYSLESPKPPKPKTTTTATTWALKARRTCQHTLQEGDKVCMRATEGHAVYGLARGSINIEALSRILRLVGELPSGGGDRDAASHLNVDQPPRRA